MFPLRRPFVQTIVYPSAFCDHSLPTRSTRREKGVRMRTLIGGCLLAFALLGQASAQLCETADTAKLPRFDVATIRPFGTSGVAGLFVYPGGMVRVGHLNLRMLLMFTCGLPMEQIQGGPAWADSAFFNAEAKPPENSPSTQSKPANPNQPPTDEQRQMLLALLIDRFQLKYHAEKKDAPAILLERGKQALKLAPAKDAKAFPWFGGMRGGVVSEPTGIAATNITMPELAKRLSRSFGKPVLDRTGLDGAYDFRVETGDEKEAENATHDDVLNSIVTSLGELGLKLTSTKAPTTFLVIDSAQKPSEN
jgi:uncharacterized protein (TIGR03435 family)